MKTIRFRPTGAIWRLATFYGPLYADSTLRRGTDICAYTKAAIQGLGIALLVAIVLGSVALALVDFLIWGWVMVIHGTIIEPNPTAVLGTCLVMLGTFVAVYLYVQKLFERWQLQRQLNAGQAENETLSQIAVMRDAWKRKFCANVVFRDTNGE